MFILRNIFKFVLKDIIKYYILNVEDVVDFIIIKGDDGIFELIGDKLFVLFNRIDFNNELVVKCFVR